ncbi:BrnT family toxin [Allohahella marinimesophila]|uniref:BrnT family toxin n=1 Tax=Allohahella marinimesophila TaxID=1054972 RepID=A0ABP7NSK0_9GAMM
MSKTNFEWDDTKNDENVEKHGVSFFEAQHAFMDRHRIIAEDTAHSATEKRYFCFGEDKDGVGILTVRFTYRSGKIRIFGAGYWRKGKRIYDKENSVQ